MIVSRSFRLLAIARCITLACLVACQLETKPPAGGTAEITAFDLLKTDNPGLPQDVTGNISGDAITLDVPAESDVTSLVPTILYNGSAVLPGSGEAQDFSAPVSYTVTTPAANDRSYLVSVIKAAASSKEILRFVVGETRATINGNDVALTLPFGSEVSMLRPSIVHNGKSVSPDSGSAQDFSKPVEYTVTAADGTSRTYRVIVTVAPSDAKDITAFTVGEISAVISGTQITLAMPYGTDVHALEPSISFTGISVTPDSGSRQDFREPVTYTVTAADGTVQVYTVLVSITQSSAKEITRFTLGGRNAAINGTTISLTLPYGTDLAHLQPIVQHTGKSLSPSSGAEQNFTQPVTYTVTAADGSKTQYTVTLSVAPNTAKEITSLEIQGVTADISGASITLTLPFGTPVTALAPNITHTGTIIQPASGVAHNFSSPVDYVVTAADGSMRTYTVTVTVAQSNAKQITRFTLLGLDASITGTAIALTVPFGSNVQALMPAIVHTGASVAPAATVAQDFRQPVMYTVTAADGSSTVYTVTVTVAKNPAKNITSFSILNLPATVGTNTVTLTVPFGTNLTQLTPTIVITGMSVSPNSGVQQNFSAPVTYTVTAEDQTTKDYLVTVTAAKNPAKRITGFTINSVPATITENTKTITLTLPFNTDLTSLTPTITHTGMSISPLSGTARNFSSTVIYTVTAEDNTTQDYTVTVSTAAASSNKDILTFNILNVTPIFGTNPDTISITVPMGTAVTSLTPTITISGTSVSPMSGEARDFSMPVVYTVTAENGSTKPYTVTVTVAP